MYKITLWIWVLITLSPLIGKSQENVSLRKKQFNTQHGLGIDGYDPVSYFQERKASKGQSSLAYSYGGITYYFSSNTNLELFKKNPAAYEPQYGGWCAYAMGNTGEKVEVDPETFKLVNGKLYLFYNQYFTNTLKYWNKKEAVLMKQANENWTKIFK